MCKMVEKKLVTGEKIGVKFKDVGHCSPHCSYNDRHVGFCRLYQKSLVKVGKLDAYVTHGYIRTWECLDMEEEKGEES